MQVSVAPGEDGNKASQLLKQLTTKGKVRLPVLGTPFKLLGKACFASRAPQTEEDGPARLALVACAWGGKMPRGDRITASLHGAAH